jgi:adenylate kinase
MDASRVGGLQIFNLMKFEAILLLGPTGSGKSPLGDLLEQDSLGGRRCHHFDFGASLRDIVAGKDAEAFTAEEIQLLRCVLAEGALLEVEHSPLAARILEAFVIRRGVQTDDLLVVNGLPRHREQTKAVDQTIAVIGVVQLDCDAGTVRERVRRNCGGDRTQRRDDLEVLVARKLLFYEQRTRPLVDYYRGQGACVLRVPVTVETLPAEIASQMREWQFQS